MNPSPDRGKECLPPKKRESRQGSTEQRLPLDEFKPPAPLRSRPASTGRGEGVRECHDGLLTNTNPHLLPSPPPIPAPVAPLPLPWHLAYPPSVPLPLLSVGERRATGSPSWRDEPIPSPLPHHSRWYAREVPLHLPPPSSSVSSSCSSSSSSPTFKSPFPADSREMWPYFNAGRRDYGSSHLFPPPPPPPHLFSHAPLYPADAGHRYLGKRPNGLDGPGSRTAPASRAAPVGEYGNDGGGVSGGGGGGRARPDLSPRGSHANGRRRLPEGGPLYLGSPAPEGPDTHSSLQDRDPRSATRIPSSSSSSSSTSSSSSSLLSTSPQPHGPDPRAGRGALLDPLGGSPAEAQIYYSLGSVYSTLQQSQHHHHHHSPQGPGQAYPLYSPSGSPLYGLAKEHRAPGPRNSQHSPVGLRNSHDRTQREPERERERERSKEREREKEREQDRETERTSERERQRDRDRDRDRGLSPGPYPAAPARASPPAPLAPRAPALLPHFAKGSLIELAGGRLKRVEELRTEDFLRSASTSPEFHLSACTVMLIAPGSAHGFSHLQVLLTDRNTQELLTVLVEYPFFVRDRGWSSCCPHRTTQLYGLPCRQLSEGDVCLALTPTPAPAAGPRLHAPRPAARAHRTQPRARVAPEPGGARHHHHREEMPPPPPPPPLPQHHHHHHHPPQAALGPSPPAPAPDPPAQEQPRPRKRRWSAPDTLTGTENTPSELPQGSKQRKWQ